jgi:hypothetical protein
MHPASCGALPESLRRKAIGSIEKANAASRLFSLERCAAHANKAPPAPGRVEQTRLTGSASKPGR